jgi:DNA polymerase-1
MNRLLIIDGNAMMHRAYHAIPPLTAPDGSVVNVVYGFATMLLRLYEVLAPQYVAVTFDRPSPTFRKKLFTGYQSKRPKMEESLVEQIPKVHALVEAFDIPIFEKDGFEADDVIGTLALKAISGKVKKAHIDQVIIVTGDRDILQLVDGEHIMVYMPTKGLSEGKIYQDADVIARLGIHPKQITDYKGLAGDSSDNYPGVAGIGPKTAIALLEAFGSVESIYKALKKHDTKLSQFSESVLLKLSADKQNAVLSKDLATIRTNVEFPITISPITTLNTEKSRTALSEFHFHSLLKRMGVTSTAGESELSHAETVKSPITSESKPKGEQQELF